MLAPWGKTNQIEYFVCTGPAIVPQGNIGQAMAIRAKMALEASWNL
jgi:hypothetical protein